MKVVFCFPKADLEKNTLWNWSLHLPEPLQTGFSSSSCTSLGLFPFFVLPLFPLILCHDTLAGQAGWGRIIWRAENRYKIPKEIPAWPQTWNIPSVSESLLTMPWCRRYRKMKVQAEEGQLPCLFFHLTAHDRIWFCVLDPPRSVVFRAASTDQLC